MTADQTFVIVGAGLAGAKAAQTLREDGFDGRVVLVGAEQERPYERPPLSKDYLRGETERGTIYVHDEAFYRELFDVCTRSSCGRVAPLRTSTLGAATSRSVTARGCAMTGC